MTTDETTLPIRRRRRLTVFGVIAVLIVVVLAALWLARKPIAERYVDRMLAANGVRASYGIADLGVGRQRLTNVVIGDPARPDLVADWIETETVVGLDGAKLSGVRAGRLRLRGVWRNDKLSLGAIDRLLPTSSGKPFALPALDLDVADARMRLATPIGLVGVALAGRGRLDRGFAGRMALAANPAVAGCAADRTRAALRVETGRGGVIRLVGPVTADAMRCGGIGTGGMRSDVQARLVAGDTLRWSMSTRLAVDDVRHPSATARTVAGTVTLHDQAGGLAGRAALAAANVRTAMVRAARLQLDGAVAFADGRPGYRGRVDASGVDARALLPQKLAAVRAGTPIASIAQALATATNRAAARFDVAATLTADAMQAHVAGVTIRSASGATASLDGAGVDWRRRGGTTVDGTVTVTGGGFPRTVARVTRTASGAIAGAATVAAFSTPDARLALAPVRFASAEGGVHATSTATLSGPLGGGRVDGLVVPLDIRSDRHGVRINPACTPVAMQRLVLSGLVLAPTRVTLCPTGDALVRIAQGRVSGGARLPATRLTGRLGTTPLEITAAGGIVDAGARRFALRGVSARIGSAARQTRLGFEAIGGTLAGGALTGSFAGGSGQIANVPLLLGGAGGAWSFARSELALTGAMTVADAATVAPRFRPLDVQGLALQLRDNAIVARGTLVEPTTATRVAEVTIDHDLGAGRGAAELAVPGVTFTKTFQPELLTRLTFGVVADVRGTVTGSGHIGWSATGVTSTGTFSTTGTDLAAAFGPVTGIAGTITFTDLLALESAPGQVARVATINPGIAVTDGVITYRTLSNSRIQVDGARWPFAGGALSLDPTLLDFSAPQARRMTFRIDGANADQFLQQFDFKNLDATGVFDGTLPMIFDETGGRIEAGALKVRAGGGSIAYVGELTQKDLGIWGNIAFQALKSLRYRDLGIVMNGPLAGEMITEVRFAGISQGAGAKSNFVIRRLQQLPFIFNIRIKAPFRGLIDSAASFYDPSRLIQRNLPQLLEHQRGATPPIQPPESEKMP